MQALRHRLTGLWCALRGDVSRFERAWVHWPLVLVVGALVLLGLVMVYSASLSLSDGPKFVRAVGNYYYFFHRQLLFVGLGIVAAFVLLQMPMGIWKRIPRLWYFIVMVSLLLLVFVPGLAHSSKGGQRWIHLGVATVQPSEFVKLMMVMFIAGYIVSRHGRINQFVQGLLPIFVLTLLLSLVVLMQNDLGSTIVIWLLLSGMLLLGGVSFGYFATGIATIALLAWGMIAFNPWRQLRVLAFWSPYADNLSDTKAYQLGYSLIAVAQGKLTGQGLGNSVQKLHILPEQHTDFILAIIGEELGFAGMVLVCLLFCSLFYLGFGIAKQALKNNDLFNGLAANGVVVLLMVQTLFNLFVVTGLLPTKGLALPFISYGGSAMLVSLMAVGVLLRIDYENRCYQRGQTQLTTQANIVAVLRHSPIAS